MDSSSSSIQDRFKPFSKRRMSGGTPSNQHLGDALRAAITSAPATPVKQANERDELRIRQSRNHLRDASLELERVTTPTADNVDYGTSKKPTIRWADPDRPREALIDSSSRANVAKAYAHVKRMSHYYGKWTTKRETLAVKRTELAHIEANVLVKLRFVQGSIRDLSDSLDGMLPQDSSQDFDLSVNLSVGSATPSTAILKLRTLRTTFDDDLAEYQAETQRAADVKEEVKRLEVSTRRTEDKFFQSLKTFEQFVGDIPDDEVEALSDVSYGSSRHIKVIHTAPEEIEDLLDKVGDCNISYEHLINLQRDHEEAVSRRAFLLAEQGTETASTDGSYVHWHESALKAYKAADDAFNKAYQHCKNLNLDPDRYLQGEMQRPSSSASDADQDEAGVSSRLGYEPVATDPMANFTIGEEGLTRYDLLRRGINLRNLDEVFTTTVSSGIDDREKVTNWLQETARETKIPPTTQQLHDDSTAAASVADSDTEKDPALRRPTIAQRHSNMSETVAQGPESVLQAKSSKVKDAAINDVLAELGIT